MFLKPKIGVSMGLNIALLTPMPSALHNVAGENTVPVAVKLAELTNGPAPLGLGDGAITIFIVRVFAFRAAVPSVSSTGVG